MHDGWQRTQIGAIADIVMGQSPPSDTVTDNREAASALPFLQGNAEFGPEYPKPKFSCTSPLKLARPGDILISVRAPVGEINHADQSYAIGRGLAAVNFHGVGQRIGYRILQSQVRQLRRAAQGSTFDAVSTADIISLVVHIPSLPEQQKITEVLDAIDGQIDAAKVYLSKLKRQLDGAALSLCIDAGWPDVCLRDTLDAARGSRIQTGPFGSQLHAYDYVTDGIPVVMPQDIVAGRISITQIATIGANKVAELSRHRLREGDLVFSRRGDLNRCAVVTSREVGWLCGTGCLLVRAGDVELLPGWLALAYQGWRCQQQVAARAVGSTMQNLNTGVLESLTVPLAPVEEQRRVLAVIGQYRSACVETEAEIAKLTVLKQALMDDLLTGRVRVPVGADV